MGDLVREDPADFAASHSADQPLRQCNRGCLATSNRKSDRKPLTDPAEMRDAIETGAAAERIKHFIEYRCLPPRHRAGADCSEHEPWRHPPGEHEHHGAGQKAPQNSVPLGDDPLGVRAYHAPPPTVETADK